jgi:hypothetical protein
MATESLKADPRQEATELIQAATDAGVTLRVTGGVAVALLCPSARREPLARSVKDLDLVGRSKERKAIEGFMTGRGYEAEPRFNLLQGDTQLMFGDPVNVRQVDVFLEQLNMCHELRFADRLDRHALTLDPADLLLSKLQIVQATDKDLRDIAAILLDAELDEERIIDLLGSDWGWWRTAQGTLDSTQAFVAELAALDERQEILARIEALRERIDAAPKSMRWRARARIGDRKRWYELPEDTR